MTNVGGMVLPMESIRPISIFIDGQFTGHMLASPYAPMRPDIHLTAGEHEFEFNPFAQTASYFMSVVTTLNFGGRTEEAVQHYQAVLDAEVMMLMRFRECPDPSFKRPGLEDKIFHATIRIGLTELMASDVGCDDPKLETGFSGFAFAVRAGSIEDAERYFAGLSEHGRVIVPLSETFFATRYGIVNDRFGVSWKITMPGEPPATK